MSDGFLPEDYTHSVSPMGKAASHHHNVYVILLDDAVAKHPSVLRSNPKRDPAKPCVYVGMTGLPVEHRFENHKHGYKSAWTVEKYGKRLMPEFYEHLNPMPFEAAAQMEKDLAEDLRAQGYTVTGGT
jgi:predicted GIY-YIG superfamily endonuclease